MDTIETIDDLLKIPPSDDRPTVAEDYPSDPRWLLRKYGQRICRLVKQKKLRDQAEKEGDDGATNQYNILMRNEINLIWKAKQAIALHEKKVIEFVKEINSGAPLSDEYIREHMPHIAAALHKKL